MPWKPSDAARHNKGLTPAQQKTWANVANGVLNRCMADGGSQQECEAKAIRIANSMADKQAPQ